MALNTPRRLQLEPSLHRTFSLIKYWPIKVFRVCTADPCRRVRAANATSPNGREACSIFHTFSCRSACYSIEFWRFARVSRIAARFTQPLEITNPRCPSELKTAHTRRGFRSKWRASSFINSQIRRRSERPSFHRRRQERRLLNGESIAQLYPEHFLRNVREWFNFALLSQVTTEHVSSRPWDFWQYGYTLR